MNSKVCEALGWVYDSMHGYYEVPDPSGPLNTPWRLRVTEVAEMYAIPLDRIPLVLARGSMDENGCSVGWAKAPSPSWAAMNQPYLSKRLELGI